MQPATTKKKEKTKQVFIIRFHIKWNDMFQPRNGSGHLFWSLFFGCFLSLIVLPFVLTFSLSLSGSFSTVTLRLSTTFPSICWGRRLHALSLTIPSPWNCSPMLLLIEGVVLHPALVQTHLLGTADRISWNIWHLETPWVISWIILKHVTCICWDFMGDPRYGLSPSICLSREFGMVFVEPGLHLQVWIQNICPCSTKYVQERLYTQKKSYDMTRNPSLQTLILE